jgi:hypothetical protein
MKRDCFPRQHYQTRLSYGSGVFSARYELNLYTLGAPAEFLPESLKLTLKKIPASRPGVTRHKTDTAYGPSILHRLMVSKAYSFKFVGSCVHTVMNITVLQYAGNFFRS